MPDGDGFGFNGTGKDIFSFCACSVKRQTICMEGVDIIELKLSKSLSKMQTFVDCLNVFQQKSKTLDNISEIIMRFCLGLSQ